MSKVGELTVTAIPVTENWFVFFVATQDGTKNIQFTAWSDRIEDLPAMTDEFGNKYLAMLPTVASERLGPNYFVNPDARQKHIRAFWKTLRAAPDNGSGPVTSASPRADLIAYQPLAPKAKKMKIELPAKNVGGAGMLKFEFEVDKVRALFAN